MIVSGKIRSIISLLSLMTIGSTSFAQSINDFADYTKIDKKITIGFETGRSFAFQLFKPSSKVKKSTKNTTSIIARIPLTAHFKVQTGLNFSIFKTPAQPSFNGKLVSTFNPIEVSVPATIEYHFCRKSRKFKPYVGAGFQYNILTNRDNNNTSDAMINNYMPQAGYKTVDLIFTQGVIYEINTKIQVTQSFHFAPTNGVRTIGINLGVGFTL